MKLCVAIAFLLVSQAADARCVPYAPTLAEVEVKACGAISIPAYTPGSGVDGLGSRSFSGTIVFGRVTRRSLVWLTSDAVGAIPDHLALPNGEQFIILDATPEATCPPRLPATISVVAAPRCCESNICDAPFPTASIEQHPERRIVVKGKR